MSSDTFVQFPFLPAIKPGQYGPIFEVRTYLLKPNGLGPTIEAWDKVRAGAAEALADPRRDVFGHRGGHAFHAIWPYPSLDVRANTRKTAIETGVWPPPGGPDHLLTMHTDIFLPASFSPIR